MTIKFSADGPSEQKILYIMQVVAGAIAHNGSAVGSFPVGQPSVSLPPAAEDRLKTKIEHLTSVVELLANQQLEINNQPLALPPANPPQQLALSPTDPRLQQEHIEPGHSAGIDISRLPEPHSGFFTGPSRPTRSGIIRTTLEKRGLTGPRSEAAITPIELPPEESHENVLAATAAWVVTAPFKISWGFLRFMVLLPRRNRVAHIIIRVAIFSIMATGYIWASHKSERIPDVGIPNLERLLQRSSSTKTSTDGPVVAGESGVDGSADPADPVGAPDAATDLPAIPETNQPPIAPPGNSASKVGVGKPIPAQAE